MDRNLARKNVRSGLIVTAVCLLHVRHDIRRRGHLHLMSPLDPEVHPPARRSTSPGGSVQPILLAFFIAVAIVGVTTNVFLVIAGVVASAWIIVAWIRDTRRDIDELAAWSITEVLRAALAGASRPRQ